MFAARMGPREVAKTETSESTIRILSRFQRGQFYDLKSAPPIGREIGYIPEDRWDRRSVVGPAE